MGAALDLFAVAEAPPPPAPAPAPAPAPVPAPPPTTFSAAERVNARVAAAAGASTAPTTTPVRKKGKAYPVEGLQHMLTEMFRRNPGMPVEIRRDAQARARAADAADPVDTDALWCLLQELREAWDASWTQRPGTAAVAPARPARVETSSPPTPLELLAADDAPAETAAPSPVPSPAPVPDPAPPPAPVAPPPATPPARERAPHGLRVAAHEDLDALAQVRTCSVCGEGLIPAPPAARVCPVCGAVGLLPSYRDVPRDFLPWLVDRTMRSRLTPGITRQQLFADLLRGVYVGRVVGEGHEKRLIRYTTPAGEIYRYALVDYAADVSAGRLTTVWED